MKKLTGCVVFLRGGKRLTPLNFTSALARITKEGALEVFQEDVEMIGAGIVHAGYAPEVWMYFENIWEEVEK